MCYAIEDVVEKINKLSDFEVIYKNGELHMKDNEYKVCIRIDYSEYSNIFKNEDNLNEFIVERINLGISFMNFEIYTVNDGNVSIELNEMDLAKKIEIFMKYGDNVSLGNRTLRILNKNIADGLEGIELFDKIFYHVLNRSLLSVKIKEIAPIHNIAYNMEDLAKSYLFALSLNKNLTCRLILDSEDFFERRFFLINRARRVRSIDVPRKKYIDDIVEYYQMAKSTRIPYVQYLSYYHILEYFYESIYEENVINELQQVVVSPKFNYKEKNSYKGLLKVVENMYKYRADKGIIKKESFSLILTLERFLSKENLIGFLSNNKYFIENDVVFSSNTTIIINDDYNIMIKRLAKRIYSTRNALVHSKDGEKIKYRPFYHDKLLELEIALIRYIAEEVIINSAEIL